MSGQYEAGEADEQSSPLRCIRPCAEFVLSEPSSNFLAFWKKKTYNPSIFVVFIYHNKQFYYYLCIDINDKLVKNMTDKQRTARNLTRDYGCYLFDQENLVEESGTQVTGTVISHRRTD